MQNSGKYDNLLKTLGIVALVLVVLSLLDSLLAGGRTGMGYGEHFYGYQTGLGLDGLIASVLALALKILWLVLVISLIAGAVVFIKKYLNENKLDLSFIEGHINAKRTCPACGAGLKADYRFCPDCGLEATEKPKESTGNNQKSKTPKKSQEGVNTDE